jgi:hypothetical protein
MALLGASEDGMILYCLVDPSLPSKFASNGANFALLDLHSFERAVESELDCTPVDSCAKFLDLAHGAFPLERYGSVTDIALKGLTK